MAIGVRIVSGKKAETNSRGFSKRRGDFAAFAVNLAHSLLLFERETRLEGQCLGERFHGKRGPQVPIVRVLYALINIHTIGRNLKLTQEFPDAKFFAKREI